jgi:hypothetical protein
VLQRGGRCWWDDWAGRSGGDVQGVRAEGVVCAERGESSCLCPVGGWLHAFSMYAT